MSKRVKPKQKITVNPIEGTFDIITDNNFSYESIPENKKLTIDDNNQMVVMDEFLVDGELRLEGTLILED